MDDRQRNKLNMYVLVKDFLLASVVITNKIEALTSLISTFSGYVAEIFTVSEKQERDFKGVTKNKRAIRDALIKMILKVSKKSVGYASGASDEEFLGVIRFGKSHLGHMADAQLLEKAEDLVKIVTPKLPELAGYLVTANDMDTLSGLTDDFRKIYTVPTGNKKSKATLTKQLKLLYSKTDEVLVKIDKQVDALFDTDTEFHDRYFKNRALVNLGKRYRALQMWLTDNETGLPLSNAVVKVYMKADGTSMPTNPDNTLLKFVKKSGEKGGIYQNNMPAGEYIYEISKGGYVTATGTIYVNDGVMSLVRVGMVKRE
jgi:hypothetical protein